MGRYQRLIVCFFDGEAEEEGFCLLSTTHHSRCEAVTWMTDGTPSLLPPCSTFMLPPVSPTGTYYQTTYANVESTEAYLEDYNRLMVDSGNYFLVSCDYFEKTSSGLCRLTGGPVFTMDNGKTKETGETMGILLQNSVPCLCRNFAAASQSPRGGRGAPCVREPLLRAVPLAQCRRRGRALAPAPTSAVR